MSTDDRELLEVIARDMGAADPARMTDAELIEYITR